MTKLTQVINGKAANKAINLLVNTAGMITTGLAVATAAAVFTPSAEAKVQNCWSPAGTPTSIGNTRTNAPGRRTSERTGIISKMTT